MLQSVRFHMQNSTKVNKPWTRIAPRTQYNKIFYIVTKSFGGGRSNGIRSLALRGGDFSEHNGNLRSMVEKFLWKNPATETVTGFLASENTLDRSAVCAKFWQRKWAWNANCVQTQSVAGGNTLDFSTHLPSIVREGAFVGEPQVPTTFERSGRPARRRLTFIGSQSPNQTKKHLFRCLFVWLVGTL